MFFHLYVNGGTQERKCNFIEIFFQWASTGRKMNKNTISTTDIKIYFSEKCNLVLDADMVWDAASCATNVKCFFIYYCKS